MKQHSHDAEFITDILDITQVANFVFDIRALGFLHGSSILVLPELDVYRSASLSNFRQH